MLSKTMATILLIDDDLAIVEAVTIALESEHHSVMTCTEPTQWSTLIEQSVPDLILVDYFIKGVSGQDIIRTLKSTSSFASIPVLLVSAHSNLKELAQSANADGYLEKPFDLTTLFALVQQYTGHQK